MDNTILSSHKWTEASLCDSIFILSFSNPTTIIENKISILSMRTISLSSLPNNSKNNMKFSFSQFSNSLPSRQILFTYCYLQSLFSLFIDLPWVGIQWKTQADFFKKREGEEGHRQTQFWKIHYFPRTVPGTYYTSSELLLTELHIIIFFLRISTMMLTEDKWLAQRDTSK